jgi:hypothetical protein
LRQKKDPVLLSSPSDRLKFLEGETSSGLFFGRAVGNMLMLAEVSLSGPNAALTKKHFSKRWQDSDVREVHVIVLSAFQIYVMKSARDHHYQLMAHDFLDGLQRCLRKDLEVFIYPFESEFIESHFFQVFKGLEASRLAR